MTRISSRAVVWAGVGLASVAIGMASPAAAQQGDDSIIVTARRSEERLQDVPISISVVSQAQLSDRNITNAAQLSTYVPSLGTDQRYGGDAVSFNIRGFFQENVSTPTVGVYFADAVQPRGGSVANITSGDGVGAGLLFDLQNVQVLKGPQGTLFGRNTTGGTVLLVPTKPTQRFEGYVEGSLGNYDLRRVQGVLNLPLADMARLRLGFDRQTRDGWQKNISGIGPRRFSSSDYYALRASLVLDLASNLENYTVGSFARSKPTPSINAVLACNPAPGQGLGGIIQLLGVCDAQVARRQAAGFNSVENSLDRPVVQYTRQWQTVNTTTWTASDNLTIKNILAYSQFRSRFRSTIFGENYTLDPNAPLLQIPDPSIAPLRALVNQLAGGRFIVSGTAFAQGENSADQDTLSEELQFQGRAFDNKLIWQTGGYLERSNPLGQSVAAPLQASACTNASLQPVCSDLLSAYYQSLGVPAAFLSPNGGALATVGNNASKVYYRDYGIYAQGTYAFSDKFKVTGGLRYSWDKMRGITNLVSFAFPQNGTYGPPSTIPYNPAPLIGLGPDGQPVVIRPITSTPCFFLNASPADNCTVRSRSSSNKPTGLIDFEFLPSNDVLLYAKYSRGYRQGGIQPRSPVLNYGPEKIDSYEVGTKLSFNTGALRGTFNLAGFYNKLFNQQLQASFQLSGAFYQALLNIGSSRVYGLEMDSSLRLYDNLHLDFSGAYLNTKIIETTPQDAVVAQILAASGALPTISTFPKAGNPLPLAPKYRFVVTPAYDLPIPADLGKLTVSGTLVYTSKIYGTNDDGYDPPSTSVNYTQPTTYVNANLNWNSIAGQPVDLSLFVTNLTKRKYIVTYVGGWTSLGSESGRQTDPRMFGARLRYRFGEAAAN